MPKLREIDLSKSTKKFTSYDHPEFKEGVTYLCLHGDSTYNTWHASKFSKYGDRWTFNLGSYSTDFVPYSKDAKHSTFKEVYEIIP